MLSLNEVNGAHHNKNVMRNVNIKFAIFYPLQCLRLYYVIHIFIFYVTKRNISSFSLVGDDQRGIYFVQSTPKPSIQNSGNGGVGVGARGGDATRIRQSALLFMMPLFYILLL